SKAGLPIGGGRLGGRRNTCLDHEVLWLHPPSGKRGGPSREKAPGQRSGWPVVSPLGIIGADRLAASEIPEKPDAREQREPRAECPGKAAGVAYWTKGQ